MKRRRKILTALVMAGLGTFAPAGPAFATNWAVRVAAGSSAEARSAGLPAAPSGVTASCVSSTGSSVTVTWTAVPLASGYIVLESSTSAMAGYSALSTGLTGTSFVTGKLASGNYWFEVSATLGANWNGSPSSATVETTVVKNKSCAQP